MLNRQHGVVAAFFQGEEDAHEDGLHIGAVGAAVAVAVFADDDRRADGPFGEVVVEGNFGVIQEREQVVAMPAEALDQPPRLGTVPRRVDHLLQARTDARAARGVGLGRMVVDLAPQSDGVFQESPQLFRERRPIFAGRLVFLDMFQVAQQMDQAHLPPRADDRVVSAQKSLTKVPPNSS